MINELMDYAGQEMYSYEEVWKYNDDLYRVDDRESESNLLCQLSQDLGVSDFTDRIITGTFNINNANSMDYAQIFQMAFNDIVSLTSVADILNEMKCLYD